MVEALGLDVRASSDVRSLAYGVVATPETCSTDAHLWWTFHEFCHLRDQLALIAGPAAREYCTTCSTTSPGR
jgi:hypothetical protein